MVKTTKKFIESESDIAFKSFGKLAESIEVWVYEMDTNGIFTYSNLAIEDILGYTPKEILGKCATELWLDDERTPKNIELFETSLASGKGWQNFPSKFRHKNGAEIIVESSALPLFGSDEKLIGYRGIGRDITAQWKAALDVQRERDKMKKYLEIAGVMFVVLDSNGNITMINRKGCEILGYEKEEILGKNWFDMCIPKRIRNDVKEVFNKLMARKIKPVEYYENPIITKNGEEKIILWHNTVIRDNRGKIVGVLSSGEDITERKIAMEALKQSEQKYSTLVENSSDGIVIIQDGVFKFVNRKTAYFFGIPKEELIGKVFTGVVPPEYRKMLLDRYEKRIAGKRAPKQYEIEIEKKGKRIPVSITGIKIDYKGKPATMAIISDLRDRKRVEELLHIDKNALEEKVEVHIIELQRTNKKLAEEIKQSEQREQKLLDYQSELKRKTKQLEHKNIALKEVLAQIAEEKLRIKQRMAKDIEQEIIPIVSRLKQVVPGTGKMLVELLENTLNEFVGLPGSLFPLYSKLTRREIEICGLIKSGLRTKEIAERLNLAITTIQKHRQTIRKKLKLTNKGVNLENYLNNK